MNSSRTVQRSWSLAMAAAVCAVSLVACGSDEPTGESAPEQSSPGVSETAGPENGTEPIEVPPPDLELAVSDTREDSVYPQVGDPGVDALHYDLEFTWEPETQTLTGVEVLTFRATRDADRFQLDFGEPLQISSLTVDGDKADFERDGKDLIVDAPVTADERYELAIDYAGTPQPVPGPVVRSDLATLGFHIDDENETWTIQEPFGAFTWYAVNDQPADKALYDFTLHVAAPWIGIANGLQTSESTEDGMTTTTYHLAEPASSYLTTMAFGEYTKTVEDDSDFPITYWIPASDPQFLPGPQTSPEAIEWLEDYLGPYPFDSGGILVAETQAGMETQTMITLGATEYATSPATVVHEWAHHWYGDQVSPDDWRDVWMNEGMVMYLQLIWEAEAEGIPLEEALFGYEQYEAETRASAGPPGDYDPQQFAEANIYICGAFLWDEVRKQIGDDDRFWEIARGWPMAQDNTSTNRETLIAYWNEESGQDLTELFDAWLLSPTTPERA